MTMRTIASLTTRCPPYHAHLLDNLNTLAIAFDVVYLGLPRTARSNVKYIDPVGLPENVKVEWLDEDLGPASKILAGARHAHEVDLVVTFDDDFLYEGADIRHALETAFWADRARGVTRVYAFSGTNIRLQAPPWVPWFMCIEGGWHNRRGMADFRTQKSITTVGGYAGVGYPSELFRDGDLVDHIKSCVYGDTTDLLWRNDDIVLSAYVARKEFKRILLPSIMIGKYNKEDEEPFLSPSMQTIIASARHPLILPHLLVTHPSHPRILLADVVISITVLVFALVSLSMARGDRCPRAIVLCVVIVCMACLTGYSKP